MAKKPKTLEEQIEILLKEYLDPAKLVDKDKLQALAIAIDWVKTKMKTEEAQMGSFFSETEEQDEGDDDDTFN